MKSIAIAKQCVRVHTPIVHGIEHRWGRRVSSINGRHHEADGSMAAKLVRPVVRMQGPPRDESGPILIDIVNESEREPAN